MPGFLRRTLEDQLAKLCEVVYWCLEFLKSQSRPVLQLSSRRMADPSPLTVLRLGHRQLGGAKQTMPYIAHPVSWT